MDKNKDNYDLREIKVEDDLYQNEVINEDNDCYISDEEVDENLQNYYYSLVIEGKKWFICRFDEEDCGRTELEEESMVLHIKRHLNQESLKYMNNNMNDIRSESSEGLIVASNSSLLSDNSNELTNNANNNSIKRRSSDRIANMNKKGNYVCDWLECDKRFSYLKRFETHRSEHLVQELLESDRKAFQTCGLSESTLGTKSSDIYKQNINLNPYLIAQSIVEEPFPDDRLLRSPSKRFPNPYQTFTPIKREVKANSNFNIAFKENNSLSCKGLQSASKIAKYFEKKVINGERVYCCQWNGCQFTTKRSQHIAEHINLGHIGAEFKCNKPNCFKVFRTPMSWREHQKNHICGFGIYGYGKNVIGVCRNENINQYREKVIIDNRRSFRCKWNGCGAISPYHMAMKRHIHNQHICPNRIRGKSIRNHKMLSADMSEINANLMPKLSNKKTFVCKCNAKFAANSDLIKHKNLFCKLRKVSKPLKKGIKEENNYSEALPNIQKTNTEIINDIQHESDQRNDEINGTNNIFDKSNETKNMFDKSNETKNIFNESYNKDKLEMNGETEEKFKTKIYNGVKYHLCNDCKFTTKFLNKMVEHIEAQHQQKESNIEIIVLNVEPKRKYDSIESHESIYKFDSNKRVRNETQKASNTGLLNQNINQFIDKKSIDDEPYYFCKWNHCKFYDMSLDQMTKHINDNHIGFKCDEQNCQKTFQTESSLRIHKKNHICGFGIKGRKASGVCLLENVSKYRDRKVMNGKLMYFCKWKDCEYAYEFGGSVLAHIHNRHICPNHNNSNNNNITVGQRSEMNSSKQVCNRKTGHKTQSVFVCKRQNCNKQFTSFPDLMKHEFLCKKKKKKH